NVNVIGPNLLHTFLVGCNVNRDGRKSLQRATMDFAGGNTSRGIGRYVLFCAALEMEFGRKLLKEGHMRVLLAIFVLFLLVSSGASGQSIPEVRLIPLPSSVRVETGGGLPVTPTFSVGLEGYQDPRLERAVQRFLRNVTGRTGLFVGTDAVAAGKATLVIHTDHAGKPVQELGEDESYVLEVSAIGAKLSAPNPLGILHGLQTLL